MRRQLVMFPPWQLHSVLPSDREARGRGGAGGAAPGEERARVSWAFNLMVKKASPSASGDMEMVQEELLDDLLDGLVEEL
eukprot:SAG11_NODE_1776_length_4265_cov_3.210274_2_plen_80_part_00